MQRVPVPDAVQNVEERSHADSVISILYVDAFFNTQYT